MALPPPRSTFTIPSLHDDLELDCRIYYAKKSEKNAAAFGRTFAIIAHPYAPLGGSYDDPVLALAGSVLLKQGVTLGTFNFRGAHGSAGRTSWSGEAELADFVSFFGFMLCYINAVLTETRQSDEGAGGRLPAPLLILGGYSYGSLIASCLPPLDLVSMLFHDVQQGSTECEIKQRANQMGRDLAGYIQFHRGDTLGRGRSTKRAQGAPSSPSQGVAMGGYESEAASRRISRESSRRSLDTEKIRKSIDRTRQRILARTKSDQDVHPPPNSVAHQSCKETKPDVGYLIISPVLPPISGFTTMFTKPTFERSDVRTRKDIVKDASTKDEKFRRHPTCLIYGSKDMFTSSKKVQKWAQDLSSKAGPSFCSHEIEGAGHFWTEENASQELQANLASWLSTLERHGSQG